MPIFGILFMLCSIATLSTVLYLTLAMRDYCIRFSLTALVFGETFPAFASYQPSSETLILQLDQSLWPSAVVKTVVFHALVAIVATQKRLLEAVAARIPSLLVWTGHGNTASKEMLVISALIGVHYKTQSSRKSRR